MVERDNISLVYYPRNKIYLHILAKDRKAAKPSITNTLAIQNYPSSKKISFEFQKFSTKVIDGPNLSVNHLKAPEQDGITAELATRKAYKLLVSFVTYLGVIRYISPCTSYHFLFQLYVLFHNLLLDSVL